MRLIVGNVGHAYLESWFFIVTVMTINYFWLTFVDVVLVMKEIQVYLENHVSELMVSFIPYTHVE